MKGSIVMKLKSDACVGTGESVSGIIDSEIQYDMHGIPYIPAKRIKGILREEASELVAMDTKGDALKEIINTLFGNPGSEDSGALWIGNGEIEGLEDFLPSLLAKKYNLRETKGPEYEELLSPNNVLEMFTTIRAQTAINEHGVADENFLRVSRVIRRGHTFIFKVNIKGCKNEELDFFKDIVKCIRHIGTNRNRGFGWVKCSWKDDSSAETKSKREVQNSKNSSSSIVFNYKLRLLSDCVLDKPYIPGSMILGIAAAAFLKENSAIDRNIARPNSIFANLFLKDEVVFSDAHPCVGKIRTIPTPLSLAFMKDKRSTLYNRFFPEEIPDAQYETPEFAFCSISDKVITPVKIHRDTNFHHRRASDAAVGSSGNAGSDGDLFSYDCMAAQSEFAGEIKGPEDLIGLLEELLVGKDVFIGKSRSAQYGYCRLTRDEEIIKYGNTDFDFNYEDIDVWPLLLLSNVLLYNELGYPTCSLNALLSELKEKTGFQELLIKNETTVNLSKTDGFNAKWCMPKPVERCFAKGSVIALDVSGIKNKNDRKELYYSLRSLSLGQYAGIGLGQVCIAPISEYESFNVDNEYKKQEEPHVKNFDAFKKYWRDLMRSQVYSTLKHVVLSQAMSLKHFSEIYICLNRISKSIVNFLLETIEKTECFTELESELEYYAQREENRGDKSKDTIPYSDLLETLKNDPKSSLTKTALETTKSWSVRSQSPALKMWLIECKENPEEWFIIYKKLIIQICKRVLAERRGEN